MSDRLFDELSEMELRDADALYAFCDQVRDACKALSFALQYQAEMLEADLSTLPVPEGRFGSLSARKRAKTVSWCLKQGSNAVMHAGKLSVKCYSLFKKYYLAPVADTKPRFKLPAA